MFAGFFLLLIACGFGWATVQADSKERFGLSLFLGACTVLLILLGAVGVLTVFNW